MDRPRTRCLTMFYRKLQFLDMAFLETFGAKNKTANLGCQNCGRYLVVAKHTSKMLVVVSKYTHFVRPLLESEIVDFSQDIYPGDHSPCNIV